MKEIIALIQKMYSAQNTKYNYELSELSVTGIVNEFYFTISTNPCFSDSSFMTEVNIYIEDANLYKGRFSGDDDKHIMIEMRELIKHLERQDIERKSILIATGKGILSTITN